MHLSPPLRHWHPARDSKRLISEFLHTPSELMVLAGVWLTAAPLLFDHQAAVVAYAGWSDVLSGLALVVLAYVRAVDPFGTDWVNAVTGLVAVWVMVSPFVRGYTGSTTATWNDLITGAVVIGLSAASWHFRRSEARRQGMEPPE
ncbi:MULTISPECIES: SPW repeat protein [unclassified Actinoplanes]|uniref:SPW repeat protein n=1 Tax=unclassified Actinoplanes TaxID=2626549 RepID=UPI0002FD1727|nr:MULTISPECIES: SPW repeat protein [unclassified Actinoplanes]